MKLVNLRLAMRLGITFACILAVLLTLTATVLNGMSSVRTAMNEMADVRIPGTRYINRLSTAIQSTRIAELQALQVWNDAAMRNVMTTSFKNNESTVTELLQRYRALSISDSQRQRLQALETCWQQIVTTHQGIMALLEKQQIKDASAKVMGEQRDQFKRLDAVFDALYGAEKTRSNEVSEEARGTLSNTSAVMLSGSVVALIIAVIFAFLLNRYFSTVFDQLISVSRRIARGNLNKRIDGIELTNEVGDVLRAMQEMQEGLSSTVSAVRRNADHVATASAQIARGNQDLSSRTEQQASALEETASAMEELGSTVKQNASNARNADGLAQEVSRVANDGGQVVERVVNRMNVLNDGAKKIVDIISLIDSIAFQTNLLALNASVEAARAGEQGRGFAVVASEVRNLAQRSANASREISELINESVAGIREGAELASDAGTSMRNVLEVVARLTDIMSEISSASHEQSEGVSQVGTAVVQMDQMTQQNAALVEESASAASSLHQQASELVELVRFFEVSDTVSRQENRRLIEAEQPPAARKISTAPVAKSTSSGAHEVPKAANSAARKESVVTPASDDDWETF